MARRSRVDDQSRTPFPWVWLAGGTASGGRLQRVSVDLQPNVKIEIAFKVDNEPCDSQSFSRLARSPSNFSSSRATGGFGGGFKHPRTGHKSCDRWQFLRLYVLRKKHPLAFRAVGCSETLPRSQDLLVTSSHRVEANTTAAFTKSKSPLASSSPSHPVAVI